MSTINEDAIRYIENGEPHDEVVYNRPTRDLVIETNKALGFVVEDSILYAIVLG